ncbi:MAG: hypothetical protein AABY15_08250 [Nanoarchaeota archaeon]
MKIVKVKTRKYKEKTYYRYRIDLPEEKMKEAELKEGDDLNIEAKKGELKLKIKRHEKISSSH